MVRVCDLVASKSVLVLCVCVCVCVSAVVLFYFLSDCPFILAAIKRRKKINSKHKEPPPPKKKWSPRERVFSLLHTRAPQNLCIP